MGTLYYRCPENMNFHIFQTKWLVRWNWEKLIENLGDENVSQIETFKFWILVQKPMLRMFSAKSECMHMNGTNYWTKISAEISLNMGFWTLRSQSEGHSLTLNSRFIFLSFAARVILFEKYGNSYFPDIYKMAYPLQ